jgi:hypothetical protein
MIYLDDPDLGRLDLECEDGFVVNSFEIGFPVARDVVRGRALSDGVFDDTRYLGARVITVTLRMISGGCAPVGSSQTLIDRVMPYMSPRRRPRLVWSLQRDPNEMRSAVVRGFNAPVLINQRQFPTVVFQWVTIDSFAESPDETCLLVRPDDPPEEEGRIYDLEFDRDYIPIPPIGGFFAFNAGNAPAHWRATIEGLATDPLLTVRDKQLDFSQNGGITLVTGQTLVIDTKERTILLNNDPTESRYDRVNFEDWVWDDLLMQPGFNLFRLQGSGFNFRTSLEVCWRDTYL